MSEKAKHSPISLAVFLETVPPGRAARLLPDAVKKKYASGSKGWYLELNDLPEISLFCSQESCDRFQFFAPYPIEDVVLPANTFLIFRCKNCERTEKTFAVRLLTEDDTADENHVFAYKFGEVPQFGPPLPARLLQLAGSYGTLLKKGRQAENQSLGIGAFAYYRRVVEEQKSKLIDDLVNAIKRLGGNSKALQTLEEARKETQFSKALELMASVAPKELFVSGQNPLKLLHGPLSIGLHGLTDEECLTKAHSIRIVMSALLERIQMINEEKADLDAAIKDLLT